jgi:PBP1b-binding outer membrane lipoprotein LpoB
MKYILMSLALAFLITGCASKNAGSPGQGSYTEGSNDRNSTSRVSNNLRSPGAFGR